MWRERWPATIFTAAFGVATIGGGVSNAPTLANTTASIAMGAAGSNVELMAANLESLTFAVALSCRACGIIFREKREPA